MLSPQPPLKRVPVSWERPRQLGPVSWEIDHLGERSLGRSISWESDHLGDRSLGKAITWEIDHLGKRSVGRPKLGFEKGIEKGFSIIRTFFLDFRKSLFSIRAVLPYREHFVIFGLKFCSLYGRRTVSINRQSTQISSHDLFCWLYISDCWNFRR